MSETVIDKTKVFCQDCRREFNSLTDEVYSHFGHHTGQPEDAIASLKQRDLDQLIQNAVAQALANQKTTPPSGGTMGSAAKQGP